MSLNPTSHFILLPNRPIVDENGKINQGSLKFHYWEWKGHEPTIIFAHACSFHGRCYDRVINEALNGYHVISIDLRCHGRSQNHPPPCEVQWLGGDILEFILTLNLSHNNLIGIGHSMGGYALTYAAAIATKRLFRYLLLFDPGIVPRSVIGFGDKPHELLEYILRRKNRWTSVDDMISKLEKRQPFSQWSKDILQNYCTYALNENNELTCNSQLEHALYHSSLHTNSNIFPIIEQSKYLNETPVHIVRSSLPIIIGRFDTSPTEPDLVKSFKKGRDTLLKNATHLFPMEQPEIMIQFIKQMLDEDLRSKL